MQFASGGEWQALVVRLIELVLARVKANPDRLQDDIVASYPEMDDSRKFQAIFSQMVMMQKLPAIF